MVLVDKDVEPPGGVADDVFQPLENRRGPMPDFVENSPENDDVRKAVTLLQDVDLIQDDVGIL